MGKVDERILRICAEEKDELAILRRIADELLNAEDTTLDMLEKRFRGVLNNGTAPAQTDPKPARPRQKGRKKEDPRPEGKPSELRFTDEDKAVRRLTHQAADVLFNSDRLEEFEDDDRQRTDLIRLYAQAVEDYDPGENAPAVRTLDLLTKLMRVLTDEEELDKFLDSPVSEQEQLQEEARKVLHPRWKFVKKWNRLWLEKQGDSGEDDRQEDSGEAPAIDPELEEEAKRQMPF